MVDKELLEVIESNMLLLIQNMDELLDYRLESSELDTEEYVIICYHMNNFTKEGRSVFEALKLNSLRRGMIETREMLTFAKTPLAQKHGDSR